MLVVAVREAGEVRYRRKMREGAEMCAEMPREKFCAQNGTLRLFGCRPARRPIEEDIPEIKPNEFIDSSS
jgi:hypothetical protein